MRIRAYDKGEAAGPGDWCVMRSNQVNAGARAVLVLGLGGDFCRRERCSELTRPDLPTINVCMYVLYGAKLGVGAEKWRSSVGLKEAAVISIQQAAATEMSIRIVTGSV